jgi:hypothetical protein
MAVHFSSIVIFSGCTLVCGLFHVKQFPQAEAVKVKKTVYQYG